MAGLAMPEFSLQSVVVGVGGVVISPPRDLRLLGLLTAAPHDVDPLMHRPGAGARSAAQEWSSVSRDAKRYIVERCSGIPALGERSAVMVTIRAELSIPAC